MEFNALLEELEPILKSGPQLQLAVLFGSAARSELRSDSDIDIAILPVDGDLGLPEELRLQVGLARACRRNVDLVRLDQAPTVVRWQIARHGRALLESFPGAFARFQAHATSEYLDYEPSFTRAGELFRRRLAETAKSPE